MRSDEGEASLTRPFRNMLTFLSFNSACSGGVDGFLADCTVCRICQVSDVPRLRIDLAHGITQSGDQVGLFIFRRIDCQRSCQAPHFGFTPLHLMVDLAWIVRQQVCAGAERGPLCHGRGEQFW